MDMKIKSGIVLIDEEDFEKISKFRWYVNNFGYAYNVTKRKGLLMHRFIMECPKHLNIDHINGNKLDNRKSNLRYCSQRENIRNKKKQSNNKSGYKGVSWNKEKQKWTAAIETGDKQHYLGSFINKIDAALAYNNAAIEYHGEFAKLNII